MAKVSIGEAQNQNIVISGTVVDASTQVPVDDASVFFTKGVGTRTDSTGFFKLNIPRNLAKTVLNISILGYKNAKVTIDLTKDTVELALVALQQQENQLENVVVRQKKQKYRNKNNPAVELIRQVIAHRDQNQMQAYDLAQYKKYEKMVASVSNMSDKLKDKKFFQKYQFLLQNVDTTKFPGKGLLPLYLEEKLTQNYYQKHPEKEKQIVLGEKTVDFGEFIDTRGVTSFLKRLYEEVNIYDNNISLFTNQFLSPISNMGPSFYMYYLRDTFSIDGIKVVQLYFTPRNPRDLLFRGTLYITLDGNYAVQRATLFTPQSTNINFMRELKINLDFERREDGRYMLSKSDMIGDFGLFKKGMGLFGERQVNYTDFITGQPIPPDIEKKSSVVVADSATQRSNQFWLDNRPDSLTRAEALTYKNVDTLTHMKSFRNFMDWATLFLAGYKQTLGGKFEIGPASTFYSYNPVEGFRLRFGGRTTTNLSKRYYFETYGAYGFKDRKFKYFGSATYSINDKSIYTFPQHYVRASFQHDTKIPGQELQFVQEDNLFLSLKRGNNDKWLYNDLARLDYMKEFENHFSVGLGYKYWKQMPAGSIRYINPGTTAGGDTLRNIKTTELGVTLRYAPNESFYQTKLYRVPIVNEYPVLQFRYLAGIKGLTGGEYSYNNFDFNIFKRFYLSPIGYSDVYFDAAYTAGKLPFPLLSIHHANQTYTYQTMSYNMMNFLEFVSDHYASLNIDHYFNGFFFNKIPLLQKLGWREVITAKAIYGGLRDENDPQKNPEQMRFPLTSDGAMGTFSLENRPYVEGGVGIANIFKFLRVYYLRRFTYLNNPDIPKWGIRFYMKFDF